jgi:hypothetical protein
MPNIKIISTEKKPSIPSNKQLSETVPRFKPPGGKPPLHFDRSYNRQGKK